MTVILDEETLEWHSVTDSLPDEDTTVIVYAPGANEPVWRGFYDGECWFSGDGPIYGDVDEIAAPVTAWSKMPKGPVTV